MDFILDNKWAFLIAAEVIFWISILAFLAMRYWYKLTKLSQLFFIIFIVNDLWIATMGFIDYLKTGEFSSYQMVILIVIIYASTYGKSDLRSLDAFIQKIVAKLKGEPLPEVDRTHELYGFEFAKKEWKQFLIHFMVFTIVHIAFLLIFGLSQQLDDMQSMDALWKTWFTDPQSGLPFDHSGANNFSRIWVLVLAIDAVITLSYTLFPKSMKKTVSVDK